VKDAINQFGFPIAELMFIGFIVWRIACFFAPHVDALLSAMRSHIEVSAEQLPRQTQILQTLSTQGSETHSTVREIHQIVRSQIPPKKDMP